MTAVDDGELPQQARGPEDLLTGVADQGRDESSRAGG